MIHELLGLKNNRIDPLQASLSSNKKDLSELILSPHEDPFFLANQFSNFGEMGSKIKALVQEYERRTHTDVKLESLDDFESVINKLPEFRRMAGTVSKHIALLTEMGKIVTQRQLMAVSALEQEIVVTTSQSTEAQQDITEKMQKILLSPHSLFEDKLRLVILYALRFEGAEGYSATIERMKKSLEEQCLDERQRASIGTIDKVLELSGIGMRRSELFKDNLLKSVFKAIKSEIKGVENIYTQHRPLILEQIQKQLTGDLRVTDFPFIEGSTGSAKTKYKHIIIFVTGGVTFEEFTLIETSLADAHNPDASPTSSGAANIALQPIKSVVGASKDALSKLGLQSLNRNEYKILVGGSCIHNSTTFLKEINPIDEDLTKGKLAQMTMGDEEHEAEELMGLGEKDRHTPEGDELV
jgi:vacuolar protein sorting-associated protein 45